MIDSADNSPKLNIDFPIPRFFYKFSRFSGSATNGNNIQTDKKINF